jgi:hypothetical protein
VDFRDEYSDVDSYKGSLKIAATADVIDAVFEVFDETLRVRSGDEVLGTWALPDISVENRVDGIHVSLDGEQVVVTVPNPDAFTDSLAPARRRPRGRREKKRVKAKREARPTSTGRPPRRRKSAKTPAESPPAEESPAAEESPPASASDPFPDEFDQPRTHVKPKKPSLFAGLVALLRQTPKLFNSDNWRSWLQDRLVRWSIASIGVIILALLVLFATNTVGMILVLLGMLALIIAALAVSDDLSAYRAVPDALTETTLVMVGAAAMVVGALLIFIS